MKEIYLLDCTLRDGGYINDWEFGYDVLERVFERLVSSNVDFIEIGFLDERRSFDINRSIMPTSDGAEKIYGCIDKGRAMVFAMIDYGTCDISNLQPCKESYLDGIRVIFKKQKMYEAIKYCKEVKALGYKVFTNCVSITSYSDNELIELTRLINELEPFAVTMVDTYGILHQEMLLHIFEIMDSRLLPRIKLAFHGHNNFQMGYANSLAVLNRNTDRELVVDGTLYGMGKSAGNTPVELLAMYMNERFGKAYDLSQMLEAIETDIMDIHNISPWGYKPFFYIAAMNKCHPSYVTYLMNKRTLSIKSINEILGMLQGEKKLLYDATYIEALYLDYQRNECDDVLAVQKLSKELQGKTILLIGPGPSINKAYDKIQSYIEEKKPIIIPINYIPKKIKAYYLFLTNRRRYAQIFHQLLRPTHKGLQIIATSNVISTGNSFNYFLNYSDLIDPNTEIPDNSLVMLIKALMRCGIEHIAMAGFDGYSPLEMNYADTNMEYSFAKEKADYLNNYANAFFEEIRKKVRLESITSTRYKV